MNKKRNVGVNAYNNQKGITLIALAITIIILLILAGITINMTVGQRGILTKAQEAGRNYQEAAKREDEQLANFLKEADDIMKGIEEGVNEGKDEGKTDLSTKRVCWLGDSLMSGVSESSGMLAQQFHNQTKAETSIHYMGNSTINSKNTFVVEGQTNILWNQVQAAIKDKENGKVHDLFILDGGMNDIYYSVVPQSTYPTTIEIGTAEDAEGANTLMADFNKCINTLKEEFPNAKILYILPTAIDKTQWGISIYGQQIANNDIATLNYMLHANGIQGEYNTKDAVAEALFNADPENKIVPAVNRMANLVQEIKKINGVEFLDLQHIIINNRDENSIMTNSYIRNDYMHLSIEGNQALIPSIINKAKAMLK